MLASFPGPQVIHPVTYPADLRLCTLDPTHPAGNEFWLHTLDRVKRVWRQASAWNATGPVGLNRAFRDWVLLHGSGVLVPFITARREPRFHHHIKYKNNTIAWFEVSGREGGLGAGGSE